MNQMLITQLNVIYFALIFNKAIQDLLMRSRDKANRKIPKPGGYINSTSPTNFKQPKISKLMRFYFTLDPNFHLSNNKNSLYKISELSMALDKNSLQSNSLMKKGHLRNLK